MPVIDPVGGDGGIVATAAGEGFASAMPLTSAYGSALGVGGASGSPLLGVRGSAMGLGAALASPSLPQSAAASGLGAASGSGFVVSMAGVSGMALGIGAASGSPRLVLVPPAAAFASGVGSASALAVTALRGAGGASGVGSASGATSQAGTAMGTFTVLRFTDPGLTQGMRTLATGLTVHTYTDVLTPADDGIAYYYEVLSVAAGGGVTVLGDVRILTACVLGTFDNCHPRREPTVCSFAAAAAMVCAAYAGETSYAAALTYEDGTAVGGSPSFAVGIDDTTIGGVNPPGIDDTTLGGTNPPGIDGGTF